MVRYRHKADCSAAVVRASCDANARVMLLARLDGINSFRHAGLQVVVAAGSAQDQSEE